MGLTKAQLEALNVASFPNNNEGLITPQILRDYNSASIANTVNQDTYTTDSASFNSRINALDPSGSVASFTSLNAFTASQLTINTGYNTFTQSADQRLDSIESVSGSWITESETGSFLLTASVTNDDITFTKGDGSQFTIQVATGSFALSSSYAESASYAQFAQDIYLNVKNTTGAQLNKGTVVRIIGATGDNGLIATASWTNDANSANTLGLLYENIADQAFGKVITQGSLLGINTDPTLGYAAGQILYLSSSGQYTNVKPLAPYHEVRLGQVLRAQQNNGSMYVLIQNGYELEELHDVDINTGSLANNNLLAYNSASGQWENKTLTQVGAATTGSNTFVGNQTISKNGGQFEVADPTNPQFGTASFGVSGASGGLTFKSSGSIVIEGVAGTKDLTFYGTSSFVRGIKISDDDFTNGVDLIYNTTNDVLSISRAGANSASLNVEGTFTSSLQQGYVWVGGANDRTTTVATSSLSGGNINTGSFATTGSNVFTGQQTINANNAITISGSNGFGYGITLQGAQGIKLEGTGGPRIQFPNETWLQGGENQNFEFTGDTNNPLTRGLQFRIYGSGSRAMNFLNESGPSATMQFTNTSGSMTFTAGGATSITASTLQLQGFTFPTTDGTNGQVLTTNGSRVLSFTTVSGGSINTGSFAITGSNTFRGDQIISGAVMITGSFGPPFGYGLIVEKNVRINQTISTKGLNLSGSDSTEAINSNYQNTLWQHAGNVTFSNQIAGVGSGNITISALGGGNLSLSGSQTNIAGVNFIPFSASVDTRINNIIAGVGYATTGSNTFRGNQVISGSLIQSSSNSIMADPIGQGVGTWIQNRVNISDVPGGPAPRLFISGSDGAFTEFGRGFINQDTRKVPGLGASIFTYGPTNSNGTNIVAVANDDYSVDVELQMFANSSSVGLADWDNGAVFNYIPFMQLAPNNGDNPPVEFKRDVQVTGSVSITEIIKLKGQDPLPTGNIGDLAVSGSHLYFYNGAWTQLD